MVCNFLLLLLLLFLLLIIDDDGVDKCFCFHEIQNSQNSSVIVPKLLAVAVAVNRFTLCACQVKHQNGKKRRTEDIFVQCNGVYRTETKRRTEDIFVQCNGTYALRRAFVYPNLLSTLLLRDSN